MDYSPQVGDASARAEKQPLPGMPAKGDGAEKDEAETDAQFQRPVEEGGPSPSSRLDADEADAVAAKGEDKKEAVVAWAAQATETPQPAALTAVVPIHAENEQPQQQQPPKTRWWGRSWAQVAKDRKLAWFARENEKAAKAQRKAGEKVAWDAREDLPGAAEKQASDDSNRIPLHIQLENAILVVLAIADNVLSYLVYYILRGYHDRLYNIVDLHLALLPGLEVAFLIFAGLGTACLIAMVICVDCLHLPWFHELMNLRLLISAFPCGIMCVILVYYFNETEWLPFVSLLSSLGFASWWCLSMRLHYSYQLSTASKIALDISMFAGFISAVVTAILLWKGVGFLTDAQEDSTCPFVENSRMPVFVSIINTWYCLRWRAEAPTIVTRQPASKGSLQLQCSDTFVEAFGTSIEAHSVQCPAGCLRMTGSSDAVVGCGVYSLDSSICLAALHAGVLPASGGQATVYGRLGLPAYDRCTRNSIVSIGREVVQAGTSVWLEPSPIVPQVTSGARRLIAVAPVVRTGGGAIVPQAFHFNTIKSMQEYVWLKEFNRRPGQENGIEDGKPWTRMEAIVSMRIVGVELNDERAILGPAVQPPLFRASSSAVQMGATVQGEDQTPSCTVTSTGVACRGAAAAVLVLDFCASHVKTCLPSDTKS
eukprot:TRINITY_DN1890_c1_g1_i1.p1 TRINITY_DN1890_c1_g1~~TRINITY_DN1890_c1_g1_i1.p1  ORF type:complete len:653 (+),score=85.38 TRINITY_DN1890_c1_g1_i1:66-2024(+)